MNSENPDDMLQRLTRVPAPEPGPTFNAVVWQRIARPGLSRQGRLDDLVRVLGWRAAPACLALAVGTVAGSMLVREHRSDALDVFDPKSPYSIAAVVGGEAGAR